MLYEDSTVYIQPLVLLIKNWSIDYIINFDLMAVCYSDYRLK